MAEMVLVLIPILTLVMEVQEVEVLLMVQEVLVLQGTLQVHHQVKEIMAVKLVVVHHLMVEVVVVVLVLVVVVVQILLEEMVVMAQQIQ